jgi:hypothetical protein
MKTVKRLENGIDAVSSAAKGAIQIGESGDQFLAFAAKAAPIDGVLDVAVHGSTHSVAVGANEVSHRVLADIIERNAEFTGQSIRLLSCQTGRAADGVAQNLANRLGVTVHAPNDTVWAFSNGALSVGPTPMANTGSFVSFSPRKPR